MNAVDLEGLSAAAAGAAAAFWRAVMLPIRHPSERLQLQWREMGMSPLPIAQKSVRVLVGNRS